MFFVVYSLHVMALKFRRTRVTVSSWQECMRVFAACSYDSSLSLSSHGSVGATSNVLTAIDSCGSTRGAGAPAVSAEYNGLDFRITMDSTASGPPVTITLLASTLQEKAAWCSDISQVSVFVLLFYFRGGLANLLVQMGTTCMCIVFSHNFISCPPSTPPGPELPASTCAYRAA